MRCRSAGEQFWCSAVAASTLVHRQPYLVDSDKCCRLDGSSQPVGYRDFVIRTDVQGRCRALDARLLRSPRQQEVSRGAGAVRCALGAQACGGRARPRLATIYGGSARNRTPWACGKLVLFRLRSAELAPDTHTAAWRGPVTVCRGETPCGCLRMEVRVPPTLGPATDPESKPRSQGPAFGRECPPSQHRGACCRGWRVRGRGPVGGGCSPACSRVALVSRAGPGPRGRPGSVRARRGRL